MESSGVADHVVSKSGARFRALIICLFVTVACPASAQSNEERYMLQERCGKQASEMFKNDWGGQITNTKEGQIIANYQNHYSERFNKCFYLEISTAYQKLNGKSEAYRTLRLYDINENREYAAYEGGTYGGGSCKVDDVQCGSEQDFLQLIEKYMDN